jgi:hypothetical protein
MPTPVSYLSGNTLSYQSGMVKKGTVGLNLTSSLTGNYRWWNGVEVTASQYLIYSDTYSTGASTESNVTPAAWSTPDLTDQSLLNLINTLPDRIGQTAFTTLSNALIWLNQSGKYFLVKNGYENLVTSGLTLNLDAGWTNSYSGTTSWRDISGNGKTGTLTNGPAFNSGNTGSIYFDGTDDFCVVPSSSLNGLSSGSISVWVKFLNLNFQYVLSLPNSSGNNGFDILIENGKLDSYLQALNSAGSTGSQFVPKLGIWYNIVTTYDGTTHKLFVNGILISSVGRSGTIQNGIGQTFLGRFSSGFGAYSNNYTSNAQLYNRALSQTEILQNYQLYKNRFGYDVVENGLVLNLNSQNYVSYRDTGTSWFDLTGNNNTGTLTNGPTFDSTTRGIVFDGVDDYCTFSNLPTGFQAGITNYSISIWFKLITKKEAPLLEMGNSSGDYQRIMFWLTNESPKNRLYALGASTFSYRYSSIYLDLNTVYNAVYTYNNTGTVSKLYINGVEDTGLTNQTTNGLLTSLANTWKIGADSVYGQSYCQNANIYNVSLYTKTLTSQEVLQNYYQGNIVTNGLIMNLDAGNLVSYGGTGTSWKDLTNTTTGATLTNGPTYNTSNNGSIVFDGTDDYAVGPTNMSISQNQPFTLELWVNLSSYTNLYPCLLQIKTDTTYGFIVLVTQASTYDGITFGSTDTWIRLRNAGNQLVTNTWNQIVINYNGAGAGTTSNYKMYINTQEQVLSTSGGFINLSQVNNIGTIENASRGYDNWTGRIANFKQYNRALTQSEVIQNFNAHKSRYGL